MTSRKPKSLTYRAAGVDIHRGDKFVDKIAPFAKATRRAEVLGSLGGFGSLVRIPKNYRNPVLVAGTDGVGTKLKLAFEMGRHDTVGIDLVAMNVNDVVVQGAEPLFFLDYLATSRIDPQIHAAVVKGIAAGCKLAGCALVGGETAEMPGFYQPGDYDLAGFVVGVADQKKLLTGEAVREGDVVLGLASSGVHSNGYSLVRKILEARRIKLSRRFPGSSKTVGEVLLEPTRIYVKLCLELFRKVGVHAFAHITGSGLPGNLPRVIPAGLKPVLDRVAWPRTPLFNFLQEQGNVTDDEMLDTFNWGVGMCAILPEKNLAAAMKAAKKHGVESWPIGVIERRRKGDKDFEIVW
ncbi:MAG: phosphoribosylformylglycinamidine cyclo-ligase [Bdellovibrionota bacterium]